MKTELKILLSCLFATVLVVAFFSHHNPALAQSGAGCSFDEIAKSTVQVAAAKRAASKSDIPEDAVAEMAGTITTEAEARAEPCSALTMFGTSYYVDCRDGSDTNMGTSPDRAWLTVARANRALLLPGDRLFFKRDCSWVGPLRADWIGLPSLPIYISAYGNGQAPRIENSENQNVRIAGSFQVIEYLEVRSDPPAVDPQCNNQPVGWSIGFNFVAGASYNLLRYTKASEHTAGVRLGFGAHHNQVLFNKMTDNSVLQILDRTPDNDLGAWGMVVNGDDNEIAYNYLARNDAWCSYDYGYAGNSIELYAAKRNNIHHNISHNDKVFSELGGSELIKAEDNVFAYNLHVSVLPNSRFLVVRGFGSRYGPTWRTRAYNNTVFLSHPASQAVVCGAGCGAHVLSLKNNILWAEEKAVYGDGPFIEENNIYWNSAGAPVVQLQGFSMSPTSRILDPDFAGVRGRNFRLRTSSRAIDSAALLVPSNDGYSPDLDLDLQPVPYGPGFDIGAHEYR
jgi:hypothetical protein